MALLKTQCAGDSMNISSRYTGINVFLENICGQGSDRKARVRIEGVKGKPGMTLSHEQGLVYLTEDVRIGVSNRMPRESDRIRMMYEAPQEYTFTSSRGKR